MLLRYTQQFCCGFDRNYFCQRNGAKSVNILSKITSLHFNLLFIEILMNKISVMLQSGWYCSVLILIYGETSLPSNVVKQQFTRDWVCAWLWRLWLHRMAIKGSSLNRQDARLTGRSPFRASHAKNRPIPITGRSIGASLVTTEKIYRLFFFVRFYFID